MDYMQQVIGVIGLAVLVVVCCLLLRIQQLKEERDDLLTAFRNQKKSDEKSTATQRAVIKGQLAEQFYPLTDRCDYHPSDMRFMGDFCDYVVIDGYTRCKDEQDTYIDRIVFVEIKTGKAQLSRHQKLIRDAIQQGRVEWETVHLD